MPSSPVEPEVDSCAICMRILISVCVVMRLNHSYEDLAHTWNWIPKLMSFDLVPSLRKHMLETFLASGKAAIVLSVESCSDLFRCLIGHVLFYNNMRVSGEIRL